MGAITSDNLGIFKSASYIYGNVKRYLSSFDTAGLIDEGEFPRHIDSVLNQLGIGVLQEEQAVLMVKNYKVNLPSDFVKLYAAFKCSPFINRKNERTHQQGAPISVYNDISWALFKAGQNCEMTVINKNKCIEELTITQYVKENCVHVGFNNFKMLSLSPNMGRGLCSEDCWNYGHSSPYEISIDKKCITTNFSEDGIYIKYYAYPKDDDGIPMIPDVNSVEKAIEWCINYELLSGWWINEQVPNLENRVKYAEGQYKYWMAEAKYEQKLPSFQQMVEHARRNRVHNKLAIFVR